MTPRNRLREAKGARAGREDAARVVVLTLTGLPDARQASCRQIAAPLAP
ncbi:hypothetical protein [Streptomyces sp. NPDC088707]